MTKKTFCPRCGSHKIKYEDPQLTVWKCHQCGYQGSIVVEDGNLEKKIREAKKMEKLSQKILWRR